MDRKYFTDKRILKRFWGLSIPTILMGICFMPGRPLVMWLTIGYIILFTIVGTFSIFHPVIDGNTLIIKNSLFRFTLTKYRLEKIENLKLYFGAYAYLCIKIKLKNKKTNRYFQIPCMGVKSIKPFVEELRSKGVQVGCEPYQLDNGRTIYL